MFLFLKMGLRNLARNLRRTMTTGITLAIGVMAMIFLRGLIDGVELDVCSLIVNSTYSHFKIHKAGFREGHEEEPLGSLLKDTSALLASVSKQKDVKHACQRLVFPLQLGDGRDLMPCKGLGIVPAEDKGVFSDISVQGRELKDSNDEGILLGWQLATVLDVKIGDELTVLARTVDGAMSAFDLPVIGLYKTGAPLVDTMYVYMGINVARELLDLPENSATEIAMRMKTVEDDYPAIRNFVSAYGQKLECRSWFEATADERRLMNLRRKILGVALTILAFIVALGVSNTILMATYERCREIGTMAAMGFTARQVFSLFVLEALVLGIIAGSLGCIWGAGLTSYVEEHGIPLPKEQRELAIPIPEAIHTKVSLSGVAEAFIFALLLTTFSAVYPAWRASCFKPAVALRRL